MYNSFGQQQYFQQYQQRQNMPQMAAQQVLRVNGRNGVDALQMPPNSSILALDTNAPIVWLIQTDGAGYKSPTPYSITPYQPETPVDAKALEDRIHRLEEIVNGWKSDTGRDGKQEE